MPRRFTTTTKGIGVALLILFVLVTIANVLALSNSLGIRDNCRRLSQGNDRTRGVLEHSLEPLKNGESNGDYQRIFGYRVVIDTEGKEVPNWRYRLDLAVARLEAEIKSFPPIDCTVTIIRWIEGN